MRFEVKNLAQVLRRINQQTEDKKKEIDKVLTDGAKRIEGRAAVLAPADRGFLHGSIIAKVDIPFDKNIKVNAFYGPYVEFGTKSNFKPNGRANIAAKFKGASDKKGDFIKAIMEWVKRKGIANRTNAKGKQLPLAKKDMSNYLSIAYAIANKIFKFGIKAQPYFYKAYDEIYPQIIQDLQKAIRKK